MPTLHGTPLSPFARKVLIALAEKNIEFEHNPVVHFALPDGYEKMHPLKKVPVFTTDEDAHIPDSSVILDYLDRTHPEPRLIPEEPISAAKALFLEEYVDSALAPTIATIFIEKFAAPIAMNRPTNEPLVEKMLSEKLPPLFTHLDNEIGESEYLVDGLFTVADIALASSLCNLRHAGIEISEEQYPNLRRYADQILSRPTIQTQFNSEVDQYGGNSPEANAKATA